MIAFWKRYDLSKAVVVMAAGGWRLRCTVLTIGPLGFAVIWKRRAFAKAAVIHTADPNHIIDVEGVCGKHGRRCEDFEACRCAVCVPKAKAGEDR